MFFGNPRLRNSKTEVSILLVYETASLGALCPTFRHSLAVLFSMIEDPLNKTSKQIYYKMYRNLELYMDDIKENITSEDTWSSVFIGILKETRDNDNEKSALGPS